MARRDMEILDDPDDDLLPDGPDQRTADERADAADIARLDAATGATSGEGETPTHIAARRAASKRPKMLALPANLDEAVAVVGCKLTLVSIGKPAMNVSATLGFELDRPEFDTHLMGEHAYTAGFLGGLLGQGVFLMEAPTKVDENNTVRQKLKVRIPRFLDEQTDQILLSIAPLIGGKKFLEPLLALEWPWRLNIPVSIEGELRLYEMQQSFDLTARAE